MAGRVQIASLAPGLTLDLSGNAVHGASVEVYSPGTLSPITVYQSPTGGATLPLPLVTDVDGYAPGYLAANQVVDISVNGGVAITTQVPAGQLAMADLTDGPTTLLLIEGLQLVPTPVKTAAYVASVADFVPLDATGGSFGITLPASPVAGARIGVKLIGVSGTNTVTINRGGSSDVFNVAGGPITQTLSLINQGFIFQYSSGVWYVQSGDVSIAVLDTRYTPQLTPTAVQTGNYAAAVYDYVPVDTSAAPVTITLPNAPADKVRVGVKRVAGTTNAVSIVASGAAVFNVIGGATSVSLATLLQSGIYQYSAAASIWYVTSDDIALAQLDARYVPANGLNGYAPIASPVLTGNPAAPTQAPLNNSTRLATTAYSDLAVAAEANIRAAQTGLLALHPTAIKATSYAAAAQDYALMDTTGGPLTVVLPAAPVDGTRVAVRNLVGGSPLTVNTSTGDTFQTATGPTSRVLAMLLEGQVWQYVHATNTWATVATVAPVSSLDLRYRSSSPLVMRTVHTWTVTGALAVASGSGDLVNYIEPFFVSVGASETVKVVKFRAMIGTGTSITAAIQKNGSALTGFSGISVTTTATSVAPTGQSVVEDDRLALVLTGPSGSPGNLAATLVLEHTLV